ncbi:MAG: MFS transporter [Lachnospiraceae bacterium]|nr:MFS transporter [Lachnospiraceae bacterium]
MAKKTLSPFRALYEEEKVLPVIRRSLTFMLFGNIFGNLWGTICSGGSTAVVGLATSMNAEDFHFSMLTAVTQIAALFQIPFSLLVNRTHKRKRYMLTIGLASRFLWILVGMIPFFVPEGTINFRVYSLVFLIGLSASMGSVINVSWFPWLSDLLPDKIQSRWLGGLHMIVSAVNIVGGIVIALLLDYLPPETKYVIIFLMGGSFGIIDMICFGFCKEVYHAEPKKLKILEGFSAVFRDKPFRSFLIYWTVFNFTSLFQTVYMNPYSMNVMGLSFTQIMIFCNIAGAVSAILTVQRWGKAIYRYGTKNVFLIGGIGSTVCTLFYVFSSPGNIWPTFLRHIVGALFWSGTNLAASNAQLTFSKEEIRPTYIAIFSCVTSLLGSALGSLAAGGVLELFKATGWFTGWFDSYKALFVFSVILRFVTLAIFWPTLSNERNRKPMDLVRGILRINRE